MTIEELKRRHEAEERELVMAALEEHGWRLTQAAEALGLGDTSLRSRLRVLGLLDEYLEHNPGRGRPKGAASG